MKPRLLQLLGALCAGALLLAGCANPDPLDAGLDSDGPGANTVVVGSANFPENVILAEVYAQALEAEGFTVERKMNIGAREVLYSQIASCRLTVVPEYNQALLAFLDPEATAKGTEEVNDALAEALPEQLSVLDPSEAQDNNAIVVPNELADQHGLKQIGDLAPIAKELTFGGPPEWKSRAEGYLGVQKDYGIEFREFKSLDFSGPITLSALQKGDIDAALLFSTTPQITTDNLVVLEDPKETLGVNNIVPLICQQWVPAKATAVLDKISQALTTEDLTKMNAEYSIDLDDVDQVAEKWIKEHLE